MLSIHSVRNSVFLSAAGAMVALVTSCATEVVSPEMRAVSAASFNASGTGCPDGYDLMRAKVGDRADGNADGYICVSQDGDVVDNKVNGNGGGADKVTGHANFTDRIRKDGTADLSFSFHAILTGSKLQTAKGEFDFHDLARGFHVHGDVTCATITGKLAELSGVVTQSDDATMPEGSAVGWSAIDNGEPGDGVDEVSRPFQGKREKKGDCVTVLARTVRIESGNIQVH